MKRRVVTVALAVVLALIGIVAVLAYVHKANQRAVEGLKAVRVLVANQPIPAGTSAGAALRGRMLTSRKEPLSSVPSDYVPSVTADISHLVISSPMQQGALLERLMLVSPGQATGAVAVPSGKVLVSMELCLEVEVAGYVEPGEYVAVFGTYPSGSGAAHSLQQSCEPSRQVQSGSSDYTRIVVPSVQVVSVSTGPGSSGGSTAASGTVQVSAGGSTAQSQGAVYVTLAATPAEAQRLILVSQAGLPYLALLGASSTIPPTLAPAHNTN